ncbi:hypothetical protein [Paenisporosarcina sp. TG-14]|uniref:hypothetical protein n=1 Tax=Paenisporosarcina sp. TG-14 TaxID=1231057 RepID=UPI000317021B|nr:hypothetical protein [Paenisporosarcina sp. TG-14]
MVKKVRDTEDFLHHIYIHMNEVGHFVLFSGITMYQFVQNAGPLQNLLLLKHEYKDSSFNIHTQLEFVPDEEVFSFTKEFMDNPTDLRWIDFTDERRLNMLSPQEQAELLYIGHKKESIRSPFYYQLQNRFVYLSNEDESMTKVYFRELDDSLQLVVNILNQVVRNKENRAPFWRRKQKERFPELTMAQFISHKPMLKEGVLLSLYKVEKTKVTYDLEIRFLPESVFPDEIWDELTTVIKQSPDKTIRF